MRGHGPLTGSPPAFGHTTEPRSRRARSDRAGPRQRWQAIGMPRAGLKSLALGI